MGRCRRGKSLFGENLGEPAWRLYPQAKNFRSVPSTEVLAVAGDQKVSSGQNCGRQDVTIFLREGRRILKDRWFLEFQDPNFKKKSAQAKPLLRVRQIALAFRDNEV
jgi:hypothetical protein